MHLMKQPISRLRTDTDGVTAIEYGIIAGVMAAVLLIAMAGLATQLSATLSNIGNVLPPIG